MNGETLLSQWWRTDSAQRAIERAKHARRERLDAMKKQVSDKQAEIKNAVENWKEQTQ